MASLTARIGIGSVQFGMAYGVTNLSGQVPAAEVGRILDLARARGVALLDTAAGYGESETVLGGVLRGDKEGFRVVTKLPPGIAGAAGAREAVMESLRRLGVGYLHAVLVHRWDDLLTPGVRDALGELKSSGIIGGWGASLYAPEEMRTLWDRGVEPQVLQFPMNLADQRFVPELKALREQGVEIHVRSAFLQGLLLARELPSWAGELGSTLAAVREWSSRLGTSPSALLVLWVLSHLEVDAAIVGVTSAEELRVTLDALETPLDTATWEDWLREAASLQSANLDLILPTRWPKG